MIEAVPPRQAAPLTPGQRLARGVSRQLAAMGFACIEEFATAPGLRVDVMALGAQGQIWVIECKSCVADFRADRKWEGYRAWCDRFLWAVPPDFPIDLLPDDTGLMLADEFDAEMLRAGAEHKLAPARRKALIQGFARHAARRLQALRDPGFSAVFA